MTPSTAIQRPDLGIALEEFDLEASRAGFIGAKLFPPTDVALATANFSRIKLASLLVASDDSRAPGSDYNRGQGQFQQDSYATTEHGHEEVVDDNESKLYAYTIDSEMITAKRARDVVLRNYEKRVAAKAFDTNAWTTGNGLATAVTTPWSTPATATPIDDVDVAIKGVYTTFGVLPNTLALTWDE